MPSLCQQKERPPVGLNEKGLPDGSTKTAGNESSVYNTPAYKWFENQSPGVQTAVAVPGAFAVAGAEVGAAAVATSGTTVAGVTQTTIYVARAARNEVYIHGYTLTKAVDYYTDIRGATPPATAPGMVVLWWNTVIKGESE